MAIDNLLSIWFKFWDKPVRKVSFKDRERLENLGLTEAQYRWMLVAYRKYSPYPTITNFIVFAEDELREDTVPETLACMAYLSNSKKLIEMATDMEANTSAFFPSEETRDEAERIRTKLREALT